MPVNWTDKISDWGWQFFLAVASAALGWFFYIERKIAGLRIHIADNYVKKSDMAALEQRIKDEFKEVKDGNNLILDVLMQRKIGTNRAGR